MSSGSPVEAPTISVVVDSRESTSGVPTLLARFPDVQIINEQLEVGDYVVAHGKGVIERKTYVDFIASIIGPDSRLFAQVAMMRANYEFCAVIIEGGFETVRSQIEPAAVQGALSYLALAGCQVIPSSSTEFTAGLVRTIAKHQQHGLGYEVPLRAGKPKDVQAMSKFIVEGLPGVGPGRAVGLLEHFGSPAKVFAADVAALSGAPGVGTKSAARIFEALHLPWTGRV